MDIRGAGITPSKHGVSLRGIGRSHDSQIMSPLLTVVIPTHRRAHFLPRAIDSAFLSSPEGVEVLVVPNGPDKSWESIAERYKMEPGIIWHSIEKPNANAARNVGLTRASGKFIRFLDDDDYLYPDACRRQTRALIESGGDISSGNVDVVSPDGYVTRILAQPEAYDFPSSALMPARMTAVFGHLYRRDALRGMLWDEDRAVRQDTAWLIQLSALREVTWQRHPELVGAWFQHKGTRISRGRDPGRTVLKETAELILGAHSRLASQGRLTPERLQAAADGLWSSLQKGLQYDYAYWREIARIADSFSPGRRPPSAIHRAPIICQLPPLMVETMLIPLRLTYRPIRRIFNRYGINRV